MHGPTASVQIILLFLRHILPHPKEVTGVAMCFGQQNEDVI